ncbi:MAG: outer membrane beta-barrel protein [Parafilimonas sp.]
MVLKISFLFCLAFLFVINSFSQTKDTSSTFAYSFYVDAYYAAYNDSVGEGNYVKFPSVSPRNGFGLNTAMFTAQYDAEKVRGMIALQYGDIPKSSWSSTFNNIMEAHAGVRLCKKLWLDAGFFRTHIGAEGLLPKENFASAVSVTTYYEPYYESGVRLNYNPCSKLSLNVYALNGYNIYEDNNKKKSLGLLATYLLGDKGNIGYDNYIGDDTPTSADTISHLRFYQNIFFNYQIKKLKVQIGVDYAMQKNSKIAQADKSASMFSGLLSLKYQFSTPFALYARGETFNDREGFMSGVIVDKQNNLTGLILWGATLGAEYKPTDNSYIRFEARQLQMDKDQEIFRWKDENKSSRAEIMLNMGITF